MWGSAGTALFATVVVAVVVAVSVAVVVVECTMDVMREKAVVAIVRVMKEVGPDIVPVGSYGLLPYHCKG